MHQKWDPHSATTGFFAICKQEAPLTEGPCDTPCQLVNCCTAAQQITFERLAVSYSHLSRTLTCDGRTHDDTMIYCASVASLGKNGSCDPDHTN